MNKINQSLDCIRIIGSAIMAAGRDGIPSGHLYAMVMGKMDLAAYEGAVGLLKRQAIIEENGHVLRWIAGNA